MCGIAGVATLRGDLGHDSAVVARRMADALSHRGPDDAGVWRDDVVALGHRRLAIVDLSDAGAQPMTSSSGRFVVTFNGEIYNFRQLGKELANGGWRRQGNSDTEVLLAAIETWGLSKFLERADGMFAFVLYDRVLRRLALVRDRFGEKPLSFGVHDGRLYFASELRAFKEIPGFDLSLDPAATADYFRFGHVPGGATIYAGIRRLAPASVLEVDLTSGCMLDAHSYWRPAKPSFSTPRAVDHDELLELLSRSTRDRLISDRPVGAFLSGGIDSSLVCALAAQHVSGPLTTFTMGWEDREYDESQQAATVAKALGTAHHDVRLGRSDVVAAVRRLGGVMDEPFADSSLLAVLLVASEAREHLVVALSGDGGDELFGGYNRHRWLLNVKRAHARIPRGLRHYGAILGEAAAPLAEHVLRPLPPTRRPRLVADKVRKLASAYGARSVADAYQTLLANDPKVGSERRIPSDVEEALEGSRDDVLWGLRVADLLGFLPDDVLTKVDRATMAVSLESRTPFLDREVATLALGLGVDALLGPSGGKQPLRTLLQWLVPGVGFDQSKMGFGVPLASLLRHELAATLENAIDTHRQRRAPVGPNWSNQYERFRGGDDAPAPVLWSLLTFELWAAELGQPIRWAETS